MVPWDKFYSGFLGLDLPADIRDILYDITRFELSPEHTVQTLFDALAVLPIVGGIKYIDEAGDALKRANNTIVTEKATKHGIERLGQRGFSQSDILNIKRTSNIKIQSDGAKVYIKEAGNERFNIIVEGEPGIITALKNISKKSLERLTKNYN